MLKYLFELFESLGLPGADTFLRLMGYVSFKAAAAIVISLVISMVFGGRLIRGLQRLQVKDEERKLGLPGEAKKQGTPTMGGLIILTAILVPVLLIADLTNIYILLMIMTTVWMGAVGFADDYIKVFRKNKAGLKSRFKIVGQVSLGLLVGLVVALHPKIEVQEYLNDGTDDDYYRASIVQESTKMYEGQERRVATYRTPVTNIPFVKAYRFDYSSVFKDLGFSEQSQHTAGIIVYVLVMIFIITAVSNAVNLTDGIDGLATGLSAIAIGCLGIFAYLSGNINLSDYLDILYLPNSAELVVFSAACVGACIGFLWYNTHPAQVFMGDTGSLALGGIVATLAIAIKKELLIPLLCGVFLIETVSVIVQVRYFKYTKKKYGEGKRIFLMSPLHHHYQKKGMHESKIVTRFWIIGILLAILTFVTLKLR